MLQSFVKDDGGRVMVCGCILHGGTQSIITGLPRAQTLIMKQCGIILTANGTRGSQHPKNAELWKIF